MCCSGRSYKTGTPSAGHILLLLMLLWHAKAIPYDNIGMLRGNTLSEMLSGLT